MSFFERLLPKHERVARHWNRGVAALDAGEHDAVLREARALEALHWSGWFELEARVRLEQQRVDEAIALLERGVATAPDSARLWQYLGHACKVARRWERAQEAYTMTLALVDAADRHAVAYDLALMHAENGATAAALAALDTDPAPAFGRGAVYHAEIRAGCALREGRLDEALEIVRRALEDRAPEVDSVRATLWTIRARALARRGEPDKDVRAALDEALALDKSSLVAASFVRELDGRRSENARQWRLTVQGLCWSEGERIVMIRPARARDQADGRSPGFFATYWVVADTPEQALEFCRLFEPPDVRASLAISASQELGSAPGELLGVARALGGYTFHCS